MRCQQSRLYSLVVHAGESTNRNSVMRLLMQIERSIVLSCIKSLFFVTLILHNDGECATKVTRSLVYMYVEVSYAGMVSYIIGADRKGNE